MPLELVVFSVDASQVGFVQFTNAVTFVIFIIGQQAFLPHFLVSFINILSRISSGLK